MGAVMADFFDQFDPVRGVAAEATMARAPQRMPESIGTPVRNPRPAAGRDADPDRIVPAPDDDTSASGVTDADLAGLQTRPPAPPRADLVQPSDMGGGGRGGGFQRCRLMPSVEQFGFCLYLCPNGDVRRLTRGSGAVGCQSWIPSVGGLGPND
jgi:hypothetical protein